MLEVAGITGEVSTPNQDTLRLVSEIRRPLPLNIHRIDSFLIEFNVMLGEAGIAGDPKGKDEYPIQPTYYSHVARRVRRIMETPAKRKISPLTPEQLLGPLNDVEKKYAPLRLYVAGPMQVPLPRPRAAIIGSRRASERGLDVAAEIAKILVKKKVIVVSGLAEGIDTAGHRAALDAGGRTVAVLGTPLDQVYPKKNALLQEEITKGHLAVSQFPIGYPIQRQNFVMRNRTMALIANASIIVEAGETSGSLHQGWEALRLGRPLLIWTDLLRSSLNWPQRMMRYGALELTNPEQVLDLLPSQEKILIKISR